MATWTTLRDTVNTEHGKTSVVILSASLKL